MSEYSAGYIQDAPSQNGFIPDDKSILDYVNPFEDIKGIQPINLDNSTGDPIQDSLNKLSSAPASGVAQQAPTFFDYKGLNADRYVNSAYYKELGFDPYKDNETSYGNRQTWGNTIGNAIGGGAKLAYQTFKSGWAGWGNMANALFSWDGTKLVGSADELKEQNDTQNDIMNKYAIFQTPESQESVFNKQFFGNMLQQGGFGIGTTAQFLSEELLTAGLSTEFSIAEKTALSSAKYLGKAIETGELINDAKKLGDIWKTESIAQNIWQGAKKLLPLGETADEISKAYKAGAGTLQMASIGVGGIKRALSEANMAFTESRMEAAGTYGDLYKKLTDEYITKNGQQPVGDDLNKIRDTAHNAAIDNFTVNSGILMLANRIEFDNLFSKFGNDRKITKEAGELTDKLFSVTGEIEGKEATRVYEKGLFAAAGKYSQIVADFGKKTAAWEAIKSGKGVLKFELTEGIQEVLQDLSNNTMQDYYYDLYNGVKGYSRGKSFDKAIEQEKQVNTGVQTFLMGALTGALLSPLTHGIESLTDRIMTSPQQRGDIASQKAQAISTLNAFYSNPYNFLKENIANFKVQDAASQNMEDAAKNRDRYTYNNMKDSGFAEMVSSAIKTDMLPSVLDTIRNYGDHITQEQFKDFTGLDPEESNITNVKSYFNDIANSVEDFHKSYNELHDKYGDLVQPDLYKEGTEGHFQAQVAKKALDDAIQVLVTNKYKSEQALTRAQNIYNNLSKNKSIAQSSAEAFTILGSENQMNKQIDLLSEELKGLRANPVIDKDTRKQITQKQSEFDALTKWKDISSQWNNSETPLAKKKITTAKKAYKDYINAKNEQFGLSTVISNDDIDNTFNDLADYTTLNKDHEDSIKAYNTLANPSRFVVYHGKIVDAINEVKKKFVEEQLNTINQTTPNEAEVVNTPKPEKPKDQSHLFTDVITDPDPESPTYNSTDKKPKFEDILFNKTFGRQYTDDEDKIPNTTNGTERFYAFTTKQNVLGQGYQLEVVSKYNDHFKIRQEDINPNDIKVILVKKDGEDIKYIDQEGKVLDNPDYTNIVYRSLADISKQTVAKVKDLYTVQPGTTDQQIQAKIDEHKAYQADLIERTKTGSVFLNAVSTSPGIQRVERLESIGANGKAEIAKNNLEGRVIVDNPNWNNLKSANNPEVNIGLRVATSDNSIAPGILSGRAVMQEYTLDESGNKIWGDKVTRVFNRSLNKDEKEKVTSAVIRLTALFNKNLDEKETAERNLIFNYLKNVIPWGEPRNNSDKFFYISNGLWKGSQRIDFTAKSVVENFESMLDDVYHNINNNTLNKNEEFTDIKINKQGKVAPDKSYKTYQEYLLSAKGDETPPIYTSLPRVDSGITQRTGSYLNWSDPNVQVERIPFEVKPKPEKQVADPNIGKLAKLEAELAIAKGLNKIGIQSQIDALKGQSAKSTVEEPALKIDPLGKLRALAPKTEEATAAEIKVLAKNEELVNKSDPVLPVNVVEQSTNTQLAVDPIKDMYIAAQSAVQKDGKLTATSYTKYNFESGEYSDPVTATVNIPNGNLGAGKELLYRALKAQIKNTDDEAPFRLSLDEISKTEDFGKLKEFMDKNLPQIPVNKVSELISNKAWGQFKNSAIYIYDNAEIGTGFHEAFEGVWASYLNNEEKDILRKEYRARKEYTELPEYKRAVDNYKGLSEDEIIREALSEEFRKFVLDQPIDLPKETKNIFQKLWDFIKNLLGLNIEQSRDLNNNINSVFKNISTGGFKNIQPIRELNSELPVYRAVGSLSQDETGAAVEGLAYYFFTNLYNSGNNIDSLLNDLDPEENNKLLNEYFNKAYDQVYNNTRLIGAKVQGEIEANKKSLYNEFKNFISKFGLDIDESDNILTKEENTTDGLGIRDSIKIDPKKMTVTNMKLLLASMPQLYYKDAGGDITQDAIRNTLNQPRLVDYERTHNLLLNELSNIVSTYKEDGTQNSSIDQMFAKLDGKYKYPNTGLYKTGYLWVKSLKVRLRYEDKQGNKIPTEALTADDINIRIAFIKSFTNVKTVPQKTIVGEDGYVYSLNPIDNVNIDRVKDTWSNNLKQGIISNFSKSKLITLNPAGLMVIDRESSDYKNLIDTLDKPLTTEVALNDLEKLGITFSGTKTELTKYESAIKENATQILKLIKDGTINDISDLYGSNIIGGRINTLLAIEANFTGEDNVLSYLNATGESQYSVGIPSLLANTINIINSVNNLKELVSTAPWLGNLDQSGSVVLFPYQKNSELLKLDGILFDNDGNRRPGTPLSYQVISGIGTSDYDGTSTDALQYPERLANKIHYLLQNTVFSNINSDKSTEFGIGIPGKHIISVDDVNKQLFFDSSNIVDTYKNQLLDEFAAALANKFNPSNVQYYKDSVSSLGHFRDILGTDLVSKFQEEVLSDKALYKSLNADQEFLTAHDKEISKAISDYLLTQIDETVKTLKDLDIFTKYNISGNNLYTTDAIDNTDLARLLKITGQRVVIRQDEDGEEVSRQGFSEADIKTLAGFLAFNEESLLTEQHKLIYGHPAFYKDLPKRANGATSTKEQLVDDPEVIKWTDNNMPRNDGKVRSSESKQTLKHISYKDQDVITSYNLDIAEGMYKDLINAGLSKSQAEIKVGAKFDDNGNVLGFITNKGSHTGLIKPYMELNEADAEAWVMPDFARDTLFFTGKLSKGQAKQFDYEIAYEKIALDKLGYQNYSDEELKSAQKLVDKGDPGYVFQVQKTQGFGFAEDPNYLHPVFLKHSVQPKFYRHVEGTQFEKLYLAAKKDQVDVIGFESGEKVGNVTNKSGKFTNIYNDQGELNIQTDENGQHSLPSDLAQQKMYTKFYGIQVETSAKPKQTVVRGTQVSKLVMLNFYENGKPLNEEVDRKVKAYTFALTDMLNLSKSELLSELGLSKDTNGDYQTEDLTNLVKVLRKEAENRGMPDNMIQGIDSIKNQDGTQDLKYKFDTLINREKLDNILNSIVDSRVISEKLNGKAAVQVASTLYESNPRDFMYLKDGKYQQLDKSDINNLTSDEKTSIKMQSSDLKFYHKKDGKIQSMEVYISWSFKGISPESMGLVLQNGIYKLSGDSKIDNRLLKSIGFRIPTQAMNSIESIQIKGFTPIANGDMVVVPSEMVGKSGSDFDIDKLNMYLTNHFFNAENKSLDYIEYKGSIQATKNYYSDLYDQGKLLNKKQYKEYEQYLNYWSNSNSDDRAESKLLKAIFPEQYSNSTDEDDLTQEFLDELLPNETPKEVIVNTFVKRALQNHFMSTMDDLITDESNYGQLVLPNSVETLTDLASEITQWKVDAGTKSKQNEKSPTYLRTFVGSNQIRERYLTAKRMVGIAALQGTFHSLAQVAGLQVNNNFSVKSMYYLANEKEKYRAINIKLDHTPKTEEGNFNIGSKNDVEGNSISDTGSQKLSGFVDGAKNPFVFDLNLNLNTATTSYYLDHHGVAVDSEMYFMGQPILDAYNDEFSKNRSGFKKINGTNLTKEKLFYKVVNPYYKAITGEDINKVLGDLIISKAKPKRIKAVKALYVQDFNKFAAEYPKFSKEQLVQAIKDGGKANPKLQIAVLMNYLEMNTQAQLLNNFISAIGYDNKKTKSIQENQMQVARWNKAVREGFIANPYDILTKTFLGVMKEQKEDVFKMYKQFFITMSPSVQKVFQPMENKLSNPDFFSTQDDQYQMLNRYQNFVVGYILHTTEFQENEKPVVLNQLYDELFRGKNSLAKTLNELKEEADPYISDNLIIKELLPLINIDTTKTDNISLFRNRIDTYKINNLIEALDNLNDYAIESANNKLLDFVNNLSKFSILQSGVQSSSIDFRKVLSTNTYSDLLKNILDAFETSGRELDINDVWKTFHKNNWNNSSVVPKAPKWVRFKDNSATIFADSSLSANDYLLKTVRKPGYTSDKISKLVKQKKGREAFDNVLLERRHKFTDSKGNEMYFYTAVNKLGDGFRLLEIPSSGKSIIGSSNVNTKESDDQPFSQSPVFTEKENKVSVNNEDFWDEDAPEIPMRTDLEVGEKVNLKGSQNEYYYTGERGYDNGYVLVSPHPTDYSETLEVDQDDIQKIGVNPNQLDIFTSPIDKLLNDGTITKTDCE